jgi:galactonate dehydratase
MQIAAGSHVMLTIPNFYRLEHSIGSIPAYQACLTQPLDFAGEDIRLSDRPGLGHDLNLDFLRGHTVTGWIND